MPDEIDEAGLRDRWDRVMDAVRAMESALVEAGLLERVPYREIGTAPPSESAKRKLAERMRRRLENLGYTVRLEQTPPAAA